MAFLSPLFLLGATAAVLPIVLHLLKRHPELHVRFSAVRFLRQAPVEHARRRHLRELLLLALRVAALGLLAFAFARPFIETSSAAAGADATVVAIDVSLSMSAQGQIEKARALAKQAIASSRAAAVLTFADEATVITRLSDDRAVSESAVDRVVPGLGGTRYRAAVTTAAELLREGGGRVLVVTDLQRAGWELDDRVSLPAGIKVEVVDVGPPPANLAVTALQLGGGRLTATIVNSGAEARETRLEAGGVGAPGAAASAPPERVTMTVAAGQSADASFAVPAGRWASVRVEDGVGAAGDDVRYVVLDPSAKTRVVIVTTTGDLDHDALYVARALSLQDADVPPLAVEGVSGAALAGWNEARLDGAAAIVLLSTRGLEHQARMLISEFVKKGRGAIVAVGPDIDGELLADALGGAMLRLAPIGVADERSIGVVDERHPVLRRFSGRSSLSSVVFRQVTSIRADGCETVARFTSGEAALLECEVGRGRVLLFASDMNNAWNDFPRRATFLPFLHEAVAHLTTRGRASSYLVASVPAGVDPRPGVTEVAAAAGESARLVAVNVDPAESDSGRLSTEQFLAAIASDQGMPGDSAQETRAEDEGRQGLWQLALAAVVLFLVAESLVAAKIG